MLIRNPSARVNASLLGLNDSQAEAFYAALTRKVAIIQGPPGTGKSYITTKLVQALLQNGDMRKTGRQSDPIIIICYTNNALDQLLEKFVDFTTNFVRVGSQCESEKLIPYRLKTIKEKRRKQSDLQIYRTMDIIGFTVTGAIMRKDDLDRLHPKISMI